MRKRIIVFTSTFPRWEKDTNPPFVYRLSQKLIQDFDVHVLAPHYPGSKRYEVMEGMKVHRFRYFFLKHEKLACTGGILPTLKKNKLYYLQVPFFLVAGFIALINLIIKIRPQIVHAHWLVPQGFIASIIKRLFRFHLVVTMHGADIFGLQGKFFVPIKKFTLRNADKLTAISNAIKKEVWNKVDPQIEIEVAHIGVDTKVFCPKNKDLSIRKQFDIQGPFLLYIGRLAEKKGLKYLIEALPKIIKDIPELKLIIGGSGYQEADLKALSSKLNLDKYILFLGAIDKKLLLKMFATADVFISPSIQTDSGDREGLPSTLIEAMASGCVTVTTDLEGNKELIENNKTGFLINQKDPKAIYNAVIKVLSDKKLKKRIAHNGMEFVREAFDINIMKSRYVEVLSE